MTQTESLFGKVPEPFLIEIEICFFWVNVVICTFPSPLFSLSSSFLNKSARTFPIGHLLSSFPGTSRPSVRRSATFCADQAVLGGGLLLTIGIGGPFDHIHICGITLRFRIEFHRF